VQRQVAIEAQEEVLAPSVDRADRSSGQPLGPAVQPMKDRDIFDLLGFD